MPNYREKLASVAAGGQAGRYGLLAHGKALIASHIEDLDGSEIERLYARYEARLGAAMTKTLGSAALQLYVGVVSMFLPIPAENQPGLIADLEGDPFVGHKKQAIWQIYLPAKRGPSSRPALLATRPRKTENLSLCSHGR